MAGYDDDVWKVIFDVPFTYCCVQQLGKTAVPEVLNPSDNGKALLTHVVVKLPPLAQVLLSVPLQFERTHQ